MDSSIVFSVYRVIRFEPTSCEVNLTIVPIQFLLALLLHFLDGSLFPTLDGFLAEFGTLTEAEEKYKKANVYSATCTQSACLFCGLYADVPGSFSWKGTGVYAYLQGDTRDAPPKCVCTSTSSRVLLTA